ncbi:MAG: hypothetical protein JNK63_09815 [Chthonomonas sp.]|nr:hypothetical protein [Chthonomonas sp.]
MSAQLMVIIGILIYSAVAFVLFLKIAPSGHEEIVSLITIWPVVLAVAILASPLWIPMLLADLVRTRKGGQP